jgi:FkbM family methyltransferase
MIKPLPQLITEYKLNVRGVIHVGAYKGEEYSYYKDVKIKNIIFVEPQPIYFQILKKNVGPECILFETALGNKEGTSKMYLDDSFDGQASSLLKPKIATTQFCSFSKKIDVPITKIDLLPFDRIEFNFINIDVQGYELEVFKGGIETIKNIDAIYTEVNLAELYEGCVQRNELDAFLKLQGFDRVGDWFPYAPYNWGDSLYVRSK